MMALPMHLHLLFSFVTFALAQTQFAVPANSTNWAASSVADTVVLAVHGVANAIYLVPLTNVAVTSLPVRKRAEKRCRNLLANYACSMDKMMPMVRLASLSMETAVQQQHIT